MIWTLRIACIGGMYFEEECVRTIEIDSQSSLTELHGAIQDAVDFDMDHPFEFTAGRHSRNRKIVFFDGDTWGEFLTGDCDTALDLVYPLPKSCKLYYHFDFGDDWYFEIRKSRKKPAEPEPGVKYPRVIEAVGPNPEQYPDNEE